MGLEPRIAEALEGIAGIEFALLFSSHATGQNRADSDIDVAVYVDPSMPERDRAEVRLQTIVALETTSADPAISADLSNFRRFSAILTGPGVREKEPNMLLFTEARPWYQSVPISS